MADYHQEQQKDEALKILYDYMVNGSVPPDEQQGRKICAKGMHFAVVDTGFCSGRYRFLQLNSSPLRLNSSRLQLNSSVLQLNSSRLQLNSSVLQLNSSVLQLN